MLVYRFKISSEEYDEFIREIVIQPNQTFLDFHSCLLESAEILPCEQASFFMTDKKYKKSREITLIPAKKQIKRYDPELDEMVVITVTPKLMKETRMKDFIEDPHQRMIYEYQGKEVHVFFIELVKITQSDGEGLYPKCVRWVGELPRKPEIPPEVPEIIEETPRIEVPKLVLPDLAALAKLDEIEEDETEIAEIEGSLSEFLFAEETEVPKEVRKKTVQVKEHDDEDNDTVREDSGDEVEVVGLEEEMDHLEDYDNIENIGSKYSGYGDNSEDE